MLQFFRFLFSQDSFGYDLTVYGQGMGDEAKLELAKEHYKACQSRHRRNLVLLCLALLIALALAIAGVPLRFP